MIIVSYITIGERQRNSREQRAGNNIKQLQNKIIQLEKRIKELETWVETANSHQNSQKKSAN